MASGFGLLRLQGVGLKFACRNASSEPIDLFESKSYASESGGIQYWRSGSVRSGRAGELLSRRHE
jgi:hypothetical protein